MPHWNVKVGCCHEGILGAFPLSLLNLFFFFFNLNGFLANYSYFGEFSHWRTVEVTHDCHALSAPDLQPRTLQNPFQPSPQQAELPLTQFWLQPVAHNIPLNKLNKCFFSLFSCTLDFVNRDVPNPAARPDALTWRFIEPLHSTTPPPPLLPPFSSKAEICRRSSNGKLSLRPRQVFPTDRIHRDIMRFLLWNFKPGSTE